MLVERWVTDKVTVGVGLICWIVSRLSQAKWESHDFVSFSASGNSPFSGRAGLFLLLIHLFHLPKGSFDLVSGEKEKVEPMAREILIDLPCLVSCLTEVQPLYDQAEVTFNHCSHFGYFWISNFLEGPDDQTCFCFKSSAIRASNISKMHILEQFCVLRPNICTRWE